MSVNQEPQQFDLDNQMDICILFVIFFLMIKSGNEWKVFKINSDSEEVGNDEKPNLNENLFYRVVRITKGKR